LFDDVGRAFDIVAAQRSGDLPIRGYREVERGKRAALLFFGDGDAAEPLGEAGIISDRLRLTRRRTGAEDLACLAAADLEDQRGKNFEALVEECRIDPALEPGARVGGEAELAPGRADP